MKIMWKAGYQINTFHVKALSFFQYLFLISILKYADFLTCIRKCDTPGKPRPDD